MPHIDGFDPARAHEAQLRALNLLAPRLGALPGACAPTIQRARVPVAALTIKPPADAPADTPELHLDVSLHTPQHRGLVAAGHVRWLLMHLPHPLGCLHRSRPEPGRLRVFKPVGPPKLCLPHQQSR